MKNSSNVMWAEILMERAAEELNNEELNGWWFEWNDEKGEWTFIRILVLIFQESDENEWREI